MAGGSIFGGILGLAVLKMTFAQTYKWNDSSCNGYYEQGYKICSTNRTYEG
jgi:hypothetical protein